MESLVERMIGAMRAEIEKHTLELLERYPNDLLVHDRAMLEQFAVPGAQIAWMVGHCHTHMVRLGLSDKENLGVAYLTNLANDDRFYVLSVSKCGQRFTLTEKSREAFAELRTTRVPYKREGNTSAFWLVKDGQRLGYVNLKPLGLWSQPRYQAIVTPVAGISALDRAALDLWCESSVVEAAGTLFVRYEQLVEPAIALSIAA